MTGQAGPTRFGARRVPVISASIGAGHDGAASELVRGPRAAGYEVTCHDFLDLLGPDPVAVISTYPLALVVVGSWGVGEITEAATDIAATGLATPVTVCGRNEALRRRLGRDQRASVRALFAAPSAVAQFVSLTETVAIPITLDEPGSAPGPRVPVQPVPVPVDDPDAAGGSVPVVAGAGR